MSCQLIDVVNSLSFQRKLEFRLTAQRSKSLWIPGQARNDKKNNRQIKLDKTLVGVSKVNYTKPIIHTQEGVALMMVLWVMALLGIIIAEFAFSMRTELKIVANFKEETENYYRSQAAVNQAMTEILDPKVTHHYMSGGKLTFGKSKEGGENISGSVSTEGADTVPERENIVFGNGKFSYRIEDEDSKLSLNSVGADNDVNRQVLARLLEKGAGMGEGSERDTIIDSIMDWVDKDDLHKINGAEDDYYQSLSPPYHCKDGFFDTVEELLLVKGVTPEIFFGNSINRELSYPGIAKFLTVWGTGRFNRYTADTTTAAIMYGDEAAGKPEDFYDEFGQPKQKQKSTTFSIIGRGQSQTGDGQRLIKVVVISFNKNGGPALRIRYWNDNLIGYAWNQDQENVGQ